MRKYLYQNVETNSCHKPHHQHNTADKKGTPNLQTVSEENMVWTAHLVLQLLRCHPKDRPSNCLGLKADGSCIQELHRICQKRLFLMGIAMVASPGIKAEGTGKNVHIQVFFCKGFDCILYELCLSF